MRRALIAHVDELLAQHSDGLAERRGAACRRVYRRPRPRSGRGNLAGHELLPDRSGAYYRVNTLIASRPDYLKNKAPLWERAQSSQFLSEPPSAVTGHSGMNINADELGGVKAAGDWAIVRR